MRCEGRPAAGGISVCPDDVNDDTVKLTQGDLLLCPACDNFRFPPVSRSKTGIPTVSATTSVKTAASVQNDVHLNKCSDSVTKSSLCNILVQCSHWNYCIL